VLLKDKATRLGGLILCGLSGGKCRRVYGVDRFAAGVDRAGPVGGLGGEEFIERLVQGIANDFLIFDVSLFMTRSGTRST
jgi:hypothetical protein